MVVTLLLEVTTISRDVSKEPKIFFAEGAKLKKRDFFVESFLLALLIQRFPTV